MQCCLAANGDSLPERCRERFGPPDWYGKPCWKVFPVGEASCASRCPAIKAVRSSNEIVYCEEHIFPANTLITLGVAIIPLGCEQAVGAKSILLLKPKTENADDSKFKKAMLEEAAQLMDRCTSHVQQ